MVDGKVLQPGSELRQHVDALNADGTGMSPKLQKCINRLKRIPINDSLAEGPHAVFAKIMHRAMCSSWQWIAGTQRLNQNLADVQTFCGDDGSDNYFRKAWLLWKTVGRPDGRYKYRNKRISQEAFYDNIYKMKHCRTYIEDNGGLPSLVDSDSDAGSDPGGTPPPDAECAADIDGDDSSADVAEDEAEMHGAIVAMEAGGIGFGRMPTSPPPNLQNLTFLFSWILFYLAWF